ncbi:hypothetical protein CAL28_07750 [Bordetella genomosp. 11]|uniref:MFS transporter n=1 Tax=Bordetella genomosp. 11 TaxID=1416808 RepID=A0A261UCU9_9BORD|nr:hypothetical protein CAL28_07750 [Bordetella genomosp. 11]
MYPQRPVTIVVGFPPGGPTDGLARIVAQRMGEDLRQKIVVENRPGAAGNVAAASVARATPDGYTVYLATRANVLNEVLNGSTDYKLDRDFAPVGMLATVPNVLVVGKSSSATRASQFIAQAKADPGRLSCASGGVGSTSHLLCELFQRETRTEMLHVPYRGAGPALIDIMAGQVDSKFDSLPSSLEHIRRGDLRALGILSKERSGIAPEIPTLEEAGGPGLYVESWYGLLAPTGTPQEILTRLNGSLNTVLDDARVKNAYMRAGYALPPRLNTPEVFRDLLAAEAERWYWTTKAREISLH